MGRQLLIVSAYLAVLLHWRKVAGLKGASKYHRDATRPLMMLT